MNFTGDVSQIRYRTSSNTTTYGRGALGRGIFVGVDNSDKNLYSGPYILDNDYFNMSFDYRAYIEQNCKLEIYYRVNGAGSWINLGEI